MEKPETLVREHAVPPMVKTLTGFTALDEAGLTALLEELDALREQIREQLSAIQDDEQEALDNMPESIQESEKGEQMQEYIDTMENVTGELDLIDIEDLIDQLQEICG